MNEMNQITQEYHYQCESCGYLFWSTDILFGSEVGSPVVCDECKREQPPYDEINMEIEAEFQEWAEKEVNKSVKHRTRTRAIPSQKRN